MVNTRNDDIIDKYFDLVQDKIKELISKDKEINTNDIDKFNSEIFNQPENIKLEIKNFIDKSSKNNLNIEVVAKKIYDRFKLQVKNNVFNQDDINDAPNRLLGENRHIMSFESFNLKYKKIIL